MKSSCQCLRLKNFVILCVWKEEYSPLSPAASVVKGTPDFFQLPLAALHMVPLLLLKQLGWLRGLKDFAIYVSPIVFVSCLTDGCIDLSSCPDSFRAGWAIASAKKSAADCLSHSVRCVNSALGLDLP
jgi:hypothetical protein